MLLANPDTTLADVRNYILEQLDSLADSVESVEAKITKDFLSDDCFEEVLARLSLQSLFNARTAEWFNRLN